MPFTDGLGVGSRWWTEEAIHSREPKSMDGEEQNPLTICLPVPSQLSQRGGTLGGRKPQPRSQLGENRTQDAG